MTPRSDEISKAASDPLTKDHGRETESPPPSKDSRLSAASRPRLGITWP